MDFGALLAGTASKAIDKTIENAIDTGFYRRRTEIQNDQTRFQTQLGLNASSRLPAYQTAGLRAAGLNPALAQGGTMQASAGSPPPSPGAGSSMSEILQALAFDQTQDNLKSNTALNNANARKINADAVRQERDNMRQESYDNKLTEWYNQVFPKGEGENQQFYYVNKGDFDADIDFAVKYADVSKAEVTKLESEWNKFYYRTLLDDEDAQKKFIEAFKAQQTKLINDAKSSGKQLEMQDIDIDIKKLQKRLHEISKDTLEHTNIHAFISKKDKSIEDYAEFFASLLIAAFVPAMGN